jgi:hypothetical protein
VIRSKLDLDDLKKIFSESLKDNILDFEFFKKGGNIQNFIPNYVQEFANQLWKQRPVGLGTPNAAVGEGELMFLILSPSIKKNKKYDLVITKEGYQGIYELKGKEVRVTSSITGNEFRIKTLEVAKKFNLTPNLSFRTNKLAVELEKKTHSSHWEAELKKLSIENQKKFVLSILKIIDKSIESVEKIFKPNFDLNEYIKTIVVCLFKNMIKQQKFDFFVMLGDGKNVKIISSDPCELKDQILSGKISLNSDYFRINQNYNLGWYIS